MCLTLEFFNKRADIREEYKSKGWMDLDSFLDTFSLTIDDLFDADLIVNKSIISTAELNNFKLTLNGRVLFVQKSYELIFLKAGLSPQIVHDEVIKAINKNKSIISSARLILRPIRYSDAEDLFEMDSDPLVHRYIENKPLQTIEEELEIVRILQTQYKENGISRWAVIEKKSGECVGWCGLKYFTKPFNGYCHIYEHGYRFKQKHWGKGYATESSKAVIDYAFNTMKIDTIYAMIDPENKASRHVLTKCGFKHTDTFPYDEDGFLIDWFELKKEKQ